MESAEATRLVHFAAIMEALRSVANKPAPADHYTNAELDAIIEQARKALHPPQVGFKVERNPPFQG